MVGHLPGLSGSAIAGAARRPRPASRLAVRGSIVRVSRLGDAFVRDVAQGHGFAAGDVMNTAARLQSVAEPMSVLVGPRARASAARGFEFA